MPPRVPRPALEGAGVADVVVVGAGFAGLSATQRLLAHDPGLRVTVLEAGQIGQGGTGRNSGFMIDLPHELTSADYAGPGNDRAVIALNRKAQAFAAEAVAAYDIPRASFDRVGKVNGAAGAVADGHNTSYARHLDTLDEPYERLDAQAMTELTGSRHYVSGLYTPGTVMLQPAGYIRGLAEGLARHVAIHEHSPVTGFVRAGSGWRVTTPGGHITCAKVILAVNGHLE
ncbi:MAG: NAD(P)/FAD-dependent oxidoreductase, partial [Paracoccaceae bacterium]